MPFSEDFQQALVATFAKAVAESRDYVEIVSGDLHRYVGGYPGRDHRMALCCRVMKSQMRAADEILSEPPSGQGASLVIRYRLPR